MSSGADEFRGRTAAYLRRSIWLTLLFIVPFYVMLAIAAGKLNQLFGTPIAVWNPLQWSTTNLRGAWRDIAGSSAFPRYQPQRA